jgi:hypothetical protein
MAKLILKSTGELQERVLELKPGVNRFGRSSNNDHVLPFPEISETHCEVLVENDFVFVRDLESSNGTFIDGDLIQESALYAGQALQIGLLEMVLDAPQIHLAVPELPKPESIEVPKAVPLADGYPSCLEHSKRHAIWECPHCTRVYCDECIRKLRRIGGIHLKLCPACSNPCRLTAWSEMMRKKKKGFFGSIVSKLTNGIKRTTSRLAHPPPPPRP